MPKIQGSVVHENDSDVPPTPFGSFRFSCYFFHGQFPNNYWQLVV
jgi:hypothetical protein